jgi:FixJ family two-component response regulator
MNQANMVRQTRAAGASFFIGKPYDPNVLLTVIERALGTELQ